MTADRMGQWVLRVGWALALAAIVVAVTAALIYPEAPPL